MSIKVGDIIRNIVERREGSDGPQFGHKGIVVGTEVRMGSRQMNLYVDWDPPVAFPRHPLVMCSPNGQWSTNPQFVEKIGELSEITEEAVFTGTSKLHDHQTEAINKITGVKEICTERNEQGRVCWHLR